MRGHVRKRGSRWSVIVDLPRGPDGQRRRKWHSGYRRRADAERALTEILARLETGTYIEPAKARLADFLREWVEGQRPHLRPSTWVSYRMNVELYIIPRLGDTLLQGLTASALNSLYAALLESGRADGRGLSSRSVRYAHTIVRKALADAVRENRLARNVADQARPPQSRNSSKMRTWSATELRAFLEHVRDNRYYAAWLLAASTGMRRGEIAALHWRDVDFGASRLAVTQTLGAVQGQLLFGEPKTEKGRRSVALDPGTLAALREHRTRQLEERLAWGSAYQDGDLVFARENGAPLHPDRLTQWFEKHVQAAGLRRIRLHDLRHTHASLALQAGIHPKVISERLGHATVSITLDTYSHAIPALQEEAAEKVAAVVFAS